MITEQTSQNERTDGLVTILGQVSCSDLGTSVGWYEELFGRSPDARPMDGLVEWHHGAGGLQLYENKKSAGHSSLTLIVRDLNATREELLSRGLAVQDVEPGTYVRFMRLQDPDENLIVLAQYYSE